MAGSPLPVVELPLDLARRVLEALAVEADLHASIDGPDDPAVAYVHELVDRLATHLRKDS